MTFSSIFLGKRKKAIHPTKYDLSICISEILTIFAARNEKCGEIWLLATTIKNAKMLTVTVIAPR